MGSLKDEMRGLMDEHKSCEKADDGECPGGSDGSAAPEGPQINMSQESTTHGDYQPKLHTNASDGGEGDKNPISKDQVLSGETCDQSDSIGGKSCTHTDAIPLTQLPEANKTTTATHNDTTISNKFLSGGEGDGEAQRGISLDKDTGQGREKVAEVENISVPVPSTPGFSDPRSPAPYGQHHMRTQVSLEVVQCRSAATSPMTPPEGGHSFFFPSSFGKSAGSDTKDAELQVGQQVEFCSVATSPMTPKTPSTTAFPELVGRESAQREEKEEKSEGQKSSPAEVESVINVNLSTSKEPSESMSSNASPESCPAGGLIDSQGTMEDSNQQCKQQRMGSMDQDITILVTHYGNNEEDEEEKESSFCPTEPEMVKIDEYEELEGNGSDIKREDENTEAVAPDHVQDTSNTTPPENKTEASSIPTCDEAKTDVKCEKSEVKENKGAGEGSRDISVTKPPIPESPAPFGCHNIRTQVSLEVVQCQSAATSPMTPPEGDHAFYFPSSLGRCGAVGTETKDAELQVGQQVEFRSVATAPMTPRTPTATSFPEILKAASIEEKIVEEEEDQNEQVVEEKKEVPQENEKVTDVMKMKTPEEGAEEVKNCKEKCEEPVQEVSWDEKGMTWEVYGAVVEVTVLGSAIQKHLEKQVKKRQPSMPPPPPLNPSATPLSPESGSSSSKGRAGKRGEGDVSRRRRNPFRQLMENMQQPHCCSKAHTAE